MGARTRTHCAWGGSARAYGLVLFVGVEVGGISGLSESGGDDGVLCRVREVVERLARRIEDASGAGAGEFVTRARA